MALKNQFSGWTPISAGRIYDLHVSGAAGGSVTTNLRSGDRDQDIVNRWGAS